MNNTTKRMLIALVGATLISTSVSAGNLVSPAQEPEIAVVPVFDGPEVGALPGSLGGGNGGVALGVLGLLVLGALASGGGS